MLTLLSSVRWGGGGRGWGAIVVMTPSSVAVFSRTRIQITAKVILAHSAGTASWTSKHLAVCMSWGYIWLLSKDHWPICRQNVSHDKHLVNMVVALYSVALKIHQHVFVKGSIVSLDILPRHRKLPTAIIFNLRRHGPKTCWS